MTDSLAGLRMFSLDGAIALVSGAAGYLGAAMSNAMADAGAHVILNGRDGRKLETLRDAIEARGGAATVLTFDVTSDADRARATDEIGRQFGRLDVLVNNAHHGRTGTVDTATVDDFANAFSIAVTPAFRMVQLLRPLLALGARARAGGASVINIASMYGRVSPDPTIYGDSGANNPPYYGAAKAGLLQLTRYLACHLAPERIRVNSVSPGPFPRPEIREQYPAFYEQLCSKNPMHRIGQDFEVAGPVLFLASDAASFVTGANVAVDGGWTAW